MTSIKRTASRGSQRIKESLRTWLRLLSCESVIEQHLRTLMRTHFSITLPQFDILSELERAGEQLTMSELSNELMVSNGNVTGVIDRLERIGFVKRNRAVHDRRVHFIELTSKGRKEFNKIANQHEQWVNELFADLTINDMTRLQSLLLKTRESVGK